MSRAPVPGTGKTRLIPPLDAVEAATLSACFLKDTAESIAEISPEIGSEGVVIYTPEGSESVYDDLLPDTFTLIRQRGVAFGDRLFNAVEDVLGSGYASVCLINSDSPTLPQDMLRAAVASLSKSGDRVVLGAAEDGGYYLIGLKQAHRRLFEDIDWSTSRVLAQTLERARELELEIQVLPAWYDIDDAASLRQLCEEFFSTNGHRPAPAGVNPYLAPHTRNYLASLIESDGARARIWKS